MVKRHILFCFLLVLILCLTVPAAFGEDMIIASFFPETSCYRAVCDGPDCTMTFDGAFYPDGSVHGVTDALEEVCGYYAMMPDGTLQMDIDFISAQNESSYSCCTLTPISRGVFDDAAEKADLYIDSDLDRVDIPLWDYPVYARVTMHDGIDLLVNPKWPEVSAGHLPEGTVVLICGQRYDDNDREDYDTYLLEADGIRGFALSMGLEELEVHQAKVVRSSSKDKGRSVNIRSTPDYGDNVIMEVPYGETVDVFPVTEGEFTRVYYDHGPGWMTTVRLKIIDD